MLNSLRHIASAFCALLFQMVDDWRLTASAVQHAWLTIRLSWKRVVLCVVVVGTLGVFTQATWKTLHGVSNGVLMTCPHARDGHLEDVNSLERRVWQHLYYDGTGLPDYAAWGAGGRIVDELTFHTWQLAAQASLSWSWHWSSVTHPHRPSPPEYAILSDKHVGSCWPMRGRRGTLGVSLAQPIPISSFTIEHIPRSMGINATSAPRFGELWGVLESSTGGLDLSLPPSPALLVLNSSSIMQKFSLPASFEQRYMGYSFVLLAEFTYNLDNYLPLQTFYVPVETSAALGDTSFGVVLLGISDNWGNEDYTCLYRIRVHPK